MPHRSPSVSATFALIVLNALIWLAFGVIVAANVHPALPDLPLFKGIMALLSFTVSGMLLVLVVFLGKQNRAAYYLTLILLNAVSLLTFFDDFGLTDLVVLVINIAPFVLMIKNRAWYLQARPGAA